MKYGFIGCGNMGGAIARALAKATKDFMLTDRSGKAAALAQELGVCYGTNEQAAACDRVFLGVKPQMMAQVLQPLQPILAEKKPVLITMAAGLTMESIEKLAGVRVPVIRIMPNTPVAVGKGTILYCRNELVADAVIEELLSDLRFAGILDPLEENLIDAACTVSGCGPAYAYMFLNALAEGAVACGVPREKAQRYAAATMEGAAQMFLTTGQHPEQLRDAVCSPGGSTIEGVKVLQQQGFHEAVTAALAAAYKRNLELGK